MVGRVLFLSAAAFLGYRYIRYSNSRAGKLTGREGKLEILPPVVSRNILEAGMAEETLPPAKPNQRVSLAAEVLGRR